MRAENFTDDDGNPAGGIAYGVGLSIRWQDGPRAVEGEPLAPANGAFVEDVIDLARQRLEFFQESKYRCRENALAITKLEEALHWLEHRRRDRASRGVEGRHEVQHQYEEKQCLRSMTCP